MPVRCRKRLCGVVASGLATVALLVMACPGTAATPDPFAAMNADRPAQETRAPGFRLQTFEGNPLALEDLRGKVVVFYFWRTW